MTILLLFAFISGLITIFAPCIWPILPILLSSSSNGGKRKPLGITLGIMLSFGLLTLTISYIVSIIPFDPNILRYIAVVVIGFMGLTLIIPRLSQVVEGAVSRMSGKFGVAKSTDDGFKGGFLTGLSLGVVWTPCAGPVLATIATLAATRSVNFEIVLVTIAYIAGVGIPLFIFTTFGQRFFKKSRFVNKYTGHIQQIFGVIMILTAISIITNYDKVLQAKLLDSFPAYSTFINKIENSESVKKELGSLSLSGGETVSENAPEFTGITRWLNTEKPPTIASLKGKVVLVDFWTYTCINCIRTLPYLTKWDEKYRDQGLVIVGIHAPEFEFEKKTENVQQAIDQYKIKYPVALDNDFATWKAYKNQYWPSKYIIDAEGKVRYTHFGEGKYEETEKVIQQLLKEAGKSVDDSVIEIKGEGPGANTTPEKYLGLSRMEKVTNSITNIGEKTFTEDSSLSEDFISFDGTWDIQPQYASSVANSALTLNFRGNKVFLVITPKNSGDIVTLSIDGQPVADEVAGKDVKDGQIILDKPRLYELIDLKGNDSKSHILRMEFPDVDTQIFAFTFGG